MKRFTATLDTTAKMITIVVCVILIIPFVKIGDSFIYSHDYRLLIAPVLIITALVYAALWRPTAYTVDADTFQIHRAMGVKSIPRSDIESVGLMNKEDLGFGIRTFGSGGAFGYLGRFWYKNTGHLTMYVTDKSKMILISLKSGKKLVVSPDDTGGFLKTFK